MRDMLQTNWPAIVPSSHPPFNLPPSNTGCKADPDQTINPNQIQVVIQTSLFYFEIAVSYVGSLLGIVSRHKECSNHSDQGRYTQHYTRCDHRRAANPDNTVIM